MQDLKEFNILVAEWLYYSCYEPTKQKKIAEIF